MLKVGTDSVAMINPEFKGRNLLSLYVRAYVIMPGFDGTFVEFTFLVIE